MPLTWVHDLCRKYNIMDASNTDLQTESHQQKGEVGGLTGCSWFDAQLSESGAADLCPLSFGNYQPGSGCCGGNAVQAAA